MLKDLVEKNRSYRRYYQDRHIEMATLQELVDLARLSASGMNRQVLRFILCNDRETNEKINDTLTWAGYLKGWNSPPDGEKPSAFIVIVREKSSVSTAHDEGIAAQSILLGAVEKGLGGCMIGSINKASLSRVLNLEDKFQILLVIAIGVPKEQVVIETIGASGDVRYWRDESQTNHVPKRPLDNIILSTIKDNK